MKRKKLVCLLATTCLMAISISGCLKFQLTDLHAMFAVSDSEHVIPFTASFDATLSYSPDGEIVSYVWDFGDGSSDSGPVVDHVYERDGVYTVTLKVFGSNGKSSEASVEVKALNPLPTAAFSFSPYSTMEADRVVSASEWVKFNGGDSTDDGEVVSYHWYFGDGNEAEGQEVEYRWLWPGTYNVVLTVTDNDGDESTCIQQIKVIGGTPCNADITGDVPWNNCQ